MRLHGGRVCQCGDARCVMVATDGGHRDHGVFHSHHTTVRSQGTMIMVPERDHTVRLPSYFEPVQSPDQPDSVQLEARHGATSEGV
jgi:hypothetical protein